MPRDSVARYRGHILCWFTQLAAAAFGRVAPSIPTFAIGDITFNSVERYAHQLVVGRGLVAVKSLKINLQSADRASLHPLSLPRPWVAV